MSDGDFSDEFEESVKIVVSTAQKQFGNIFPIFICITISFYLWPALNEHPLLIDHNINSSDEEKKMKRATAALNTFATLMPRDSPKRKWKMLWHFSRTLHGAWLQGPWLRQQEGEDQAPALQSLSENHM